jgi:hypothetical protein
MSNERKGKTKGACLRTVQATIPDCEAHLLPSYFFFYFLLPLMLVLGWRKILSAGQFSGQILGFVDHYR